MTDHSNEIQTLQSQIAELRARIENLERMRDQHTGRIVALESWRGKTARHINTVIAKVSALESSRAFKTAVSNLSARVTRIDNEKATKASVSWLQQSKASNTNLKKVSDALGAHKATRMYRAHPR